MRLMRFTLPLLAVLPLYASADACDTVAKWGGNAASCRANAAASGATIIDNWMTYKPVSGRNPKTGKKGLFTSTSTPATDLIGLKPKKFYFLYLDCFDQKRQMRLDEPGSVALLTLKDKSLTFKVDDQPAFTETWELDLSDKSHHAPASSALAAKLQGAKKLEVTWRYNEGKPPVGFVFAVNGFDKASASLCK